MRKRVTSAGLILFLALIITFSFALAEENESVIDKNTQESPPVTCDAYFEGYMLDTQTGECKLEKATGCENPFKHSTKEECENANLDNEDSELNDCQNECKEICPGEKCRSECINKCKVNFGFDAKEFEYDDSKYTPTESEEKIFEEYKDETLNVNAGTTPDSTFYFIDKFFDKFGDELNVREERIAEIKSMIEEGNIESAKKALEEYNQLAENLEKEVNPDKRDEALRSSSAIRNAMRDIQDKIPAGERDEFVKGIMKKEHSIATTAEISKKINDLCRELAELDPKLFYQTCKTNDEGPKWQKEMYKDLTDEQMIEAKKFGEIMSRCFKSSGKDCKCEEIPIPDFAKTCSVAAPLAMACEVENDQNACAELDNLQMPELPPHLQGIMDELENGMIHDKFDMHMPPECVKQGITNPEECGKIMIKENAPEECKEALLKANVKSEREGREICDKIMMQKHAPECAEQEILDPEKCKDFMWNINNRPEECKKNKIHDFRDCKKFLEEGGNKDMNNGPMINFDCKSITDSAERLKCFDEASSGFGNFKENFKEIKEKERQCADKCLSEEKAWDFSGGNCQCRENNYPKEDYPKGDYPKGDYPKGDYPKGDYPKGDYPKGDYPNTAKCDDCQSKCPGASRTDCVNDQCKCYYDRPEQSPEQNRGPPSDQQRPDFSPPQQNPQSPEQQPQSPPQSPEQQPQSPPQSPEPTPNPSPAPTPEPSPGPSPDSGITGNAFLEYIG